jgi:hypothetical protein
MKNISLIAMVSAMCFLNACAGNNPPKQPTDTVAKADIAKDTLRVDTNKSVNKSSTGTKKDTIKPGMPKK